MTVSTTNTREVKAGNGTTKTFSIGFEFFEAQDLAVTKLNADGTTENWTLNDEYTISGGGGSTGSLTTTQGNTLKAGESISITRQTPPLQQLDLVSNDILPAEALESQYDVNMMVNQETRGVVNRAIRFPEVDPETLNAKLPPAGVRAGRALVFDSVGQVDTALLDSLLDTTDDLPEGSTNLYYTAERARDDVGAAIVAGNNLTKTVDDANDTITLFVDITDTDTVPEGGTNLYFTDERAQDAAANMLAGGSGIATNYDDANDVFTIDADLGTGLTFSSGQIVVVAGDGLETSAGAIQVDAGGGLTASSSGVAVNVGDGIMLTNDNVTVAAGEGLTFDTGALQVDAGNGLQFNNNALVVDEGNGLTFSSGQLTVSAGNGLRFDGGGQVAVNLATDGGLQFNNGQLQVDTGGGLSLDSAGVKANLGDGLSLSSDNIQVNLGDGLQLSNDDVAVDNTVVRTPGTVARTDANNVFDSGVNGGQQTIKGGIPNLFLFEDDNTDDNARVEVINGGTYMVKQVQDDGSTTQATRWQTDLTTGKHNAHGGRIESTGTPSNDSDAATKGYVDGIQSFRKIDSGSTTTDILDVTLPSGFQAFKIYLFVENTGAGNFWIKFSNDGGSSFLSSFKGAITSLDESGSIGNAASSTDPYNLNTSIVGENKHIIYEIFIQKPLDSNEKTWIIASGSYESSSDTVTNTEFKVWETTANVVDFIRFEGNYIQGSQDRAEYQLLGMPE